MWYECVKTADCFHIGKKCSFGRGEIKKNILCISHIKTHHSINNIVAVVKIFPVKIDNNSNGMK